MLSPEDIQPTAREHARDAHPGPCPRGLWFKVKSGTKSFFYHVARLNFTFDVSAEISGRDLSVTFAIRREHGISGAALRIDYVRSSIMNQVSI